VTADAADRSCYRRIGMPLTAPALKKRYADLRSLVAEWDPLGLIDAGSPQDEYDCLVGPVFRRLEDGESPERIAAYLDAHIPEHFGLAPSPTLPFAQRASAWFRSWANAK